MADLLKLNQAKLKSEKGEHYFVHDENDFADILKTYIRYRDYLIKSRLNITDSDCQIICDDNIIGFREISILFEQPGYKFTYNDIDSNVSKIRTNMTLYVDSKSCGSLDVNQIYNNDTSPSINKNKIYRCNSFHNIFACNNLKNTTLEISHYGELDLMTRIGVDIFNEDSISGLTYFLIFINELQNPQSIARFFKRTCYLSKEKIGEIFGIMSCKFSDDIFLRFIEQFDFKTIPFHDAIRLFLLSFKISGESQKIHKVIETFSKTYYDSNKDEGVYECTFDSFETTLILGYSIIMLNVDQHNINVKYKMSPEDFVKNVRNTKECTNVHDDFLLKIYYDISLSELCTSRDNVSDICLLHGLLSLKNYNFTNITNRQYLGFIKAHASICNSMFEKKPKPHVLLLFNDCIMFVKEKGVRIKAKESMYVNKYVLYLSEYRIHIEPVKKEHLRIEFGKSHYVAHGINDKKSRIDLYVNEFRKMEQFDEYLLQYSFQSEIAKYILKNLKKSYYNDLVSVADNLEEFLHMRHKITNLMFGDISDEMINYVNSNFM